MIHYGGTDKMRILQSWILFHEKNRRNIPMQKIAFHLNSLQQGGAERVVSNLANRFAKDFLDSFFECTADSHHFADRLHA